MKCHGECLKQLKETLNNQFIRVTKQLRVKPIENNLSQKPVDAPFLCAFPTNLSSTLQRPSPLLLPTHHDTWSNVQRLFLNTRYLSYSSSPKLFLLSSSRNNGPFFKED
ncbi:uncharacterized protein LAJ45_05810 [Morchella importuna]|uniref:uncharacterized protein n=1 Tax=Morchella importuna TaxID=1174673 RepID=UPI001E8DF299|nr:uncharacterized protein LAJ45_05810 [Morchella importuna]KAH8150124.1 hypothetical protein LAJ45_05810 [Morchella importuna]